jgi:hypothetical protein
LLLLQVESEEAAAEKASPLIDDASPENDIKREPITESTVHRQQLRECPKHGVACNDRRCECYVSVLLPVLHGKAGEGEE